MKFNIRRIGQFYGDDTDASNAEEALRLGKSSLKARIAHLPGEEDDEIEVVAHSEEGMCPACHGPCYLSMGK